MKTYILAPNFQYKPSGPIQLGNIIADPFRPTKPLSTLPEDETDNKPAIESVLEYDHEIAREEGRAVGISFWTHFLAHIGADVDLTRGRDTLQQYSIAQLETRYLRDEPLDDDADLARRLREPRVQAAVNAGLFGRRPVYLVTGLKIARGFSLHTQLRRSVGSGIGAEAPVVSLVSTGVRVGSERRDGFTNSFTAGDEAIVFAYQLHKIRPPGRKQGAVVDVFRSEAAFLHDDDDDDGEQHAGMAHEGISIAVATADALIDDEIEAVSLERTELIDEETGALYECLSIQQQTDS